MPKYSQRNHRVVGQEHLLLCTPHFVPESKISRHEANPLECKAGALTAELAAQNRAYFSPFSDTCKVTPPASSSFVGDFDTLFKGYRLCATSEALGLFSTPKVSPWPPSPVMLALAS